MELESILNGVLADEGSAKSVHISFTTLQSMKNDFDKMWDDFKTSHVNFERMMHEHNQLKERAAQLQAQVDRLRMIQSKQNGRIIEQQSTILGLRNQLQVHGVQVGDEFGADVAGDVSSDWFTLEADDEDKSGDALHIGDAFHNGSSTAHGASLHRLQATGAVGGAVDGLLFLKTTRNAKRQCTSTARDKQLHTASVDEVVHAFLTSTPMYGVSGWRFKDTASALDFWTAVKNEEVYLAVDEKQRLKSAKKTLNAIGYDVTHSQDCWQEALSWGWHCVRAMKNCYWLNTTVKLDWKVKKMLQVLNTHYSEDARAITPSLDAPVDFPDLPQLTPTFVSKLFVFKPVKQMRPVEKRKLQEMVVILQMLKSFREQGKIAEVSVFRPLVEADGDVRAALLKTLQECVSAPEQAEAP